MYNPLESKLKIWHQDSNSCLSVGNLRDLVNISTIIAENTSFSSNCYYCLIKLTGIVIRHNVTDSLQRGIKNHGLVPDKLSKNDDISEYILSDWQFLNKNEIFLLSIRLWDLLSLHEWFGFRINYRICAIKQVKLPLCLFISCEGNKWMITDWTKTKWYWGNRLERFC